MRKQEDAAFSTRMTFTNDQTGPAHPKIFILYYNFTTQRVAGSPQQYKNQLLWALTYEGGIHFFTTGPTKGLYWSKCPNRLLHLLF
jgi:hypothetical protein